jgi:hypothetical protein
MDTDFSQGTKDGLKENDRDGDKRGRGRTGMGPAAVAWR